MWLHSLASYVPDSTAMLSVPAAAPPLGAPPQPYSTGNQPCTAQLGEHAACAPSAGDTDMQAPGAPHHAATDGGQSGNVHGQQACAAANTTPAGGKLQQTLMQQCLVRACRSRCLCSAKLVLQLGRLSDAVCNCAWLLVKQQWQARTLVPVASRRVVHAVSSSIVCSWLTIACGGLRTTRSTCASSGWLAASRRTSACSSCCGRRPRWQPPWRRRWCGQRLSGALAGGCPTRPLCELHRADICGCDRCRPCSVLRVSMHASRVLHAP